MKEIINQYKNWNWTLFALIVFGCIVSSLFNRAPDRLSEGIMLVSLYGIPVGLLGAWAMKGPKE